MGKIIIRSEKELNEMRLVNTSPRIVESRETVDVYCGCGAQGKTQFGNIVFRYKRGKDTWRCDVCVRKAISENLPDRSGEKNSFYGKKHSKESIDKIRKSRPEAIEKGKVTSMERYGTEFAAQNEQVRKKQQETCLKKYGFDSYMKTPDFKEKAKSTILEKYGVDNPLKSPEIIAKIKKTNLEKYGSDWYPKTQIFKDFLSQNHHSKKEWYRKKYIRYVLSDGRYIANICKEKGLNISNGLRAFKKYGEKGFLEWVDSDHSGTNLLEKMTLDILTDFGVPIQRFNKLHNGYRPDFICENEGKVVYINIDGLYWHSDAEQSNNKYHYNLRLKFEEKGERILQFREDEIVESSEIVASVIMNALGMSPELIDARSCDIRKVNPEEAKEFFEKNHLMGGHRASKAIGLYHNGCLVACMSTRKKANVVEVSRFANRCGYNVRGGFPRLLKAIEKEYKPLIILSYCDMRYSTGKSYTRGSFEEIKTHVGWSWTDGINTFNRLHCTANMDERGLSEAEHAAELGLFKIYDAGQRKYIKKIK